MSVTTRIKSFLGMEHRQANYGQSVVDQLFNAALVGRSDASATAAAVAAVRAISDAFSVATVGADRAGPGAKS